MIKKLIAFSLLSLPFLLSAQGFQVNLQGQTQQGMASAGTAFVQDAATVFYNPGGMSFLKENSISAGVSPVIAHSTFLDANTNLSYNTASPVSTPFAGYAVWGADTTHKVFNRFKFGLGSYTPFGSIATWEPGWTGRYNLTSLKLLSIFYQATASYKICDKLGIGIGLVYGTGNVELKQDIPVSSSSNFAGSADLKGKAQAWGFNAGVYYKPCSKFSIGLTYRSAMNMNLQNGTGTFVTPSSLNSNIPPTNTFTAKLPLPSVLTLGLAYSFTQKFTLALDVNYVGWHTYDTLAFDYKNNTPQFADTKLPRLYHNTFAFRLGGQYKVTDKFTARAGLGLELTPVPNGYITPEVPDATRMYYTIGLGYKIAKCFAVDASYTLEGFTRKSLTNDPVIGPSGTYKTYINVPGISVTYKF